MIFKIKSNATNENAMVLIWNHKYSANSFPISIQITNPIQIPIPIPIQIPIKIPIQIQI